MHFTLEVNMQPRLCASGSAMGARMLLWLMLAYSLGVHWYVSTVLRAVAPSSIEPDSPDWPTNFLSRVLSLARAFCCPDHLSTLLDRQKCFATNGWKPHTSTHVLKKNNRTLTLELVQEYTRVLFPRKYNSTHISNDCTSELSIRTLQMDQDNISRPTFPRVLLFADSRVLSFDLDYSHSSFF